MTDDGPHAPTTRTDPVSCPDGPSRGEPLQGLSVVEFSHMVMGPTTGVILADLGADVLKVEPPGGDNTRRLTGSGGGYFAMYNRNKRSLCADLKADRGRELVQGILDAADVVLENFRPGAMDRLGFGYAALSARNPRLIYCSLKGFLGGPYAERVALDEVTQMMGGLAYMTGLPGRPMRAGSSIVDITGGMFGAIAILAALAERNATGRGQHVTSALFETTAFLVGQHMAQQAVLGEEPAPMSVRRAAWGVYDLFDCTDGQLFVAVVSDTQWRQFCADFGLDGLASDPALAQNAGRVANRDRFLPVLRELFAGLTGPGPASAWRAPACHSPRSTSPPTCSTTRTSRTPGSLTCACPTASTPVRWPDSPSSPSRWRDGGSACGVTCLPWASTPAMRPALPDAARTR